MKQTTNHQNPNFEQLPMQINVKIYRPSVKGPILADASVNLNGCFAIRGVQVKEGRNGPFVSMPSRQVKGEYRDICFPCTPEFKQSFDQAVLDAYRMELEQGLSQRQNGVLNVGGSSPFGRTKKKPWKVLSFNNFPGFFHFLNWK